MTKIKLLTIAVFCLLAVNILTVSWFFLQRPAPNDFGSDPRPPAGPKMIIIRRLAFDQQQVAEYEVLIKQHRLTIKNLNDSISATKNALYEKLKDKNFKDQDKLIDKIVTFQRGIESTHYNHFEDIRKLCKPSQIDNFNHLTKDLASYFTSQRKALKLH
ncbi:MAG: hypothetical protein ACQUHE_02445 [Bacteroidia bacterium]